MYLFGGICKNAQEPTPSCIYGTVCAIQVLWLFSLDSLQNPV